MKVTLHTIGQLAGLGADDIRKQDMRPKDETWRLQHEGIRAEGYEV